MNYYQIVVNGITERLEQGTSYLSFFKREAQINHRDNFVEFSDFFNGCKNVVESYRKDLKRQFDKMIEEQNLGIRFVKFGRANGRNLSNTFSEAEKEESLKVWEAQKQNVIKQGLSGYVCKITESGVISDSGIYKYSIRIQTMLELLSDIIQAEKKLTNPKLDIKKSPLKDKVPKKIVLALYSAMCKDNMIEPDEESFLFWFGVSSDNPVNLKYLVWTGKSKSLLAYFADVANDKLNLKDSGGRRSIKPFETMFNISGLTCCINDYKKTGDLPIDYSTIDEIFNSIFL